MGPRNSKYASWKDAGGANVRLNEPQALRAAFRTYATSEAYVFTLHELFELPVDGTQFIWQTRSSPNWQGGILTFATCKQHMRTYRPYGSWKNLWIIGLAPAHIGNVVFFAGMVSIEIPSQRQYADYLRGIGGYMLQAKSADNDPRGDCYTWTGDHSEYEWDIRNYQEPDCDHTRKVENYPEKVLRDGSVRQAYPKWHKDVQYTGNKDRHPPIFVLDPAFMFNQRVVQCNIKPGRAARLVNCGDIQLQDCQGGGVAN